jgi:hypothetical protein
VTPRKEKGAGRFATGQALIRHIAWFFPLVFVALSTAADSPVKIVDEGRSFTLSNGQVAAQVGKTTAT